MGPIFPVSKYFHVSVETEGNEDGKMYSRVYFASLRLNVCTLIYVVNLSEFALTTYFYVTPFIKC